MRRFVTAGDGLVTIIPRRGFSFRGLLTHVQISLEEPRNLVQTVSSPIRMQGRFARLCFFDQLADAFEGRFIEYPVGKPSALATIFDRAETTQARSDSVSEQDGADRMEADDQRRTLPTHRWLGADGDADLDANECRV
jgi:hypothetical protein